jgi:hypothetical protein
LRRLEHVHEEQEAINEVRAGFDKNERPFVTSKVERR